MARGRSNRDWVKAMGDRTSIEWTDSTLNPIRARNVKTGRIGWHCQKISPGCENCYAESMNRRLGTRLSYVPAGEAGLFLDEKMLTQPLRWKKPRRVFVCSMTDLFADFVPDEWLARMWQTMRKAEGHTFQILTKRAKRMRAWVQSGDEILPNVWLGVSAEDQQRLDERVPDLLATPAAVRFVSCEPLLGQLNLSVALEGTDYEYIHPSQPVSWVIVGGESGTRRRPMDLEWARSIRDQCRGAGVPFFMKQVDKVIPVPSDLAIREMPDEEAKTCKANT